MPEKKTLLLAIDIGEVKHDWEVRAMQMQISDYFIKNKTIEDCEDVIIFPVKGFMKLFWLQGDPDDMEDVKELEQIKDKLVPVLETALGIKKHRGVRKPKKRPNKRS